MLLGGRRVTEREASIVLEGVTGGNSGGAGQISSDE